jgi:hypothetical protein
MPLLVLHSYQEVRFQQIYIFLSVIILITIFKTFKNRSTQFKARGAPDRTSCRFTTAANVAAGVTVTPVVDRESSAPAPVPYVQGSNTVVDSATLRTLAEQLRIVSEGLLATQDDMHEAKQEASDARADAATAINQSSSNTD